MVVEFMFGGFVGFVAGYYVGSVVIDWFKKHNSVDDIMDNSPFGEKPLDK